MGFRVAKIMVLLPLCIMIQYLDMFSHFSGEKYLKSHLKPPDEKGYCRLFSDKPKSVGRITAKRLPST